MADNHSGPLSVNDSRLHEVRACIAQVRDLSVAPHRTIAWADRSELVDDAHFSVIRLSQSAF